MTRRLRASFASKPRRSLGVGGWLALFTTVIAGLPAGEAAGSRSSDQLPATLDVPYISQTEALCGGAALAMVLRYWGERDVFAQDFASLIDARERGIRTSVLVTAARDRGWQAVVGSTEPTPDGDVTTHVSRGRPVIALLEEGPNRFHYVVVIGSNDAAIVVHDPARAPFRVLTREDFDRRSKAAERWMMIVLPTEEKGRDSVAAGSSPQTDLERSPSPHPCSDLVSRAVDKARAGDLEGAERDLAAAREQCPNEAAPLIELAGVRFLQSRWSEARELSERALKLAPGERQALELLAGSRYLDGDLPGALEAWNQVGEPRVDLIDVKGIARTRYPIVVSMLKMPPRLLLTADAFRQAARRLDALPAATATNLRYEPQEGGTARITASVAERQLLPKGLVPLAAIGLEAAITREVSIDVVSPTGNGEVWTAAWRWPPERPRLALQLATPSPGWLPGVLTVDISSERQTYSATSGAGASSLVESRRRAGVSVSDWMTGRFRWHLGVVFDRFDQQPAAGVEGGGEFRLLDDRVAIGASGAAWAPTAGAPRFQTATASARWRSRQDASAPVVSSIAGVSFASQAAPLALWPGAGARTGRDVLLRGHLLLVDNIVTGEVFGRQLAFGTVEYSHPVHESPFGRLSAAVFADAARAWERREGAPPSPFHIDIGTGLRLDAPGLRGRVRLDLGWGLRDGNVVLSAGWSTR